MKTIAIVPSAGAGKRLRCKIKKPFVLLGGRPLISYTLKALEGCDALDAIIIASEKSCVKKFMRLVKKLQLKKVIDVVTGGKTRFESVRNCLCKVDPSFGLVLIHDGARPFVEKTLINKSIAFAKKFGGCIVAVPEIDTVKLIGKGQFITKTLDRQKIFRAQTPQVFRRDIINKAYAIKGKRNITDDASLAEILGSKIKVLKGSYRNIKITTKEDLKFAEALL
ncbi:MAG: 2-C-methyl-D-erythritol 4-phosphate cytidylyltransferase [Candidatus Omnitrophota bacterium]|nr:2-C-methyl-D-erythritol 4-phosphate cytidylyltransferase [Candidatus Omnitrophota bacterium]